MKLLISLPTAKNDTSENRVFGVQFKNFLCSVLETFKFLYFKPFHQLLRFCHHDEY